MSHLQQQYRLTEFGRCRGISMFTRNSVKFRGNTEIPRQWPNSAARLEIPRLAENCGPYWSLDNASSRPWNQLPMSICQPHSDPSFSIPDSPVPLLITFSSSISQLCSSITPSFFHCRLKLTFFTNPSPHSLTSPWTAFMDYHPDRLIWATRIWFLVSSFFVFCAMC